MRTMAKTFPKILFVKIEKDSDTDYFVADANAHWLVEMGERIPVAQYQLVDVRAAKGVAEFGPAARKR